MSARNTRSTVEPKAGRSGKLDGVVSAANHHDPLRPLPKVQRLIRGDRVLDARDVRHARPASNRDQDPFRRQPPVADCDRVGVNDCAAAVDSVAPGILQEPHINAMQPVELFVLGVDHLGPVMGYAACRPPVTLGVMGLFKKVAAVDEELLWDTATQNTGAALAQFFYHRHLGPIRTCHPGARVPPEPAPRVIKS